jgi:hypothetical protein
MKGSSKGIWALAWISVGCGGPDLDALCQQSSDCVGGNEKDVEACIAQAEFIEDVASEIGCTDEYDELFACTEEHASCEGQSVGAACMSNADCEQISASSTCSGGECQLKQYAVKGDDCETESRAFNQCFDF